MERMLPLTFTLDPMPFWYKATPDEPQSYTLTLVCTGNRDALAHTVRQFADQLADPTCRLHDLGKTVSS